MCVYVWVHMHEEGANIHFRGEIPASAGASVNWQMTRLSM